ncbi:MAG: hypothetical protein E7Z87_04510 [Cyanobacteria bacterium SIG26]|nr:hypothetical protein [Cyanobacteria bacterium SIG26]
MSINAASSSVSSSSSTQVSNTSSSETQKSTTDTSFKEEMNKVSSNDKTEDKKESQNIDSKQDVTEKQDVTADEQDDKLTLEGQIDYSNFASKSMLDMNSILAGDIKQMMNTNSVNSIYGVEDKSKMFSLDFSNTINMDSSDAEFFINLTQKHDVSMQNITAQAQNMLNNGADVKDVKQNVQVSQTLLNALNNARENNQPIRIDFDQNISVILRVGKDGAIAATFIPGDKAVEQYLRNNIQSLKATFDEQDLPYSDLSYSNRGSKQQKEQRKNNQ